MTNVGAYTGTVSPYGAFDTEGDVYEWNDTPGSNPSLIDVLGGSYLTSTAPAESTFIGNAGGSPGLGAIADGFRVVSIASVPEPSSLLLAALGVAGLVGMIRYRRLGTHSLVWNCT